MDSEIESEIDGVMDQWGLCPRMKKLDHGQAKELLIQAQKRFLKGNSPFWWSCFSGDVKTAVGQGADLLERFTRLIGEPIHECFFFPEPRSSDSLVYIGLLSDFCELVNQCFYFEFYILDKDFRWIACEYHHGQLIMCKKMLDFETVRERISELRLMN